MKPRVSVVVTPAGQASKSFSGVVVENSYHASQKFNQWLDEARKGEELGWQAELTRNEKGYLVIITSDVPAGAQVEAELRRPLGKQQLVSLEFSQVNDALFRSNRQLDAGRWTARVRISANGESWAFESEIR